MLDEAQLAGENGQVYLFQWLSAAEKKSDHDRAEFEKTLVAIITANSPYPPPGRAIRNSVARCLVTHYSTGETRTLFDTLQAFIKLATAPEKDRDVVKIAAFWCMGELMGVYGSQFMSFMAEIAVVSVKTYRSSSNHLLRYHALIALEKALRTAKRAVSEQTLKDLNKQLKSALTDKSWAVQRAATQILIILHSGQDAIPLTTSELDAILSQSVKVLDNIDRFTRSTHARLIGHILAQTQVEGRKDLATSSASKPPADSSNDAEADDVAVSSSAAAAEGKSKALLPPYEALLCLSNHINKPSATRKIRIGIFDFYSAFLVALGSEWVEANLSTLVQHLIHDLVGHPRLSPPTIPAGSTASSVVAQTGSPHRYEALLIRHLVSILLRDLVEARMLSEQSQIATISEWAAAYLKRWPAMMPGQVEPKPSALVIGLRQVGGLVVLLGSAPSVVQNALSDPLVTLLSHPSHSVRMNAAWALRCFCASTPQRLAKTILTLSDKLSSLLSSLLTPTASPDVSPRALGHSYALAGLVSLIPHRPWYISYDVPSKVIDMAISLLKKAVDHAIPIATVEIEVAWRLLSGLMGLGKGFLRGYLPQLLVLWRNALPKVTTKDNSAIGRTAQEWVFLMHVRECALGAIWCFLRSHISAGPPSSGSGSGSGGGGLVTLDVARRIAACLSNALSFANSFLSVANVVEDPYFALSSDPSQASHRSGLPLRERESLLRSRVFECFAYLVQPTSSVSASAIPGSAAPTGHGNSFTTSAITDSTQDALLRSAISLFASAEGYGGSTVQAAIASSTGSFTSVWNGNDGYAYGVGWRVVKEVWSSDESDESSTVDGALDSFNHKPILGAAEHDPLSICLPSPSIDALSPSGDGPSSSSASSTESSITQPSSPFYLPEPPPPATAVVDSSISLFARLLPLQDANTTHKIIQLLIDEVRTTKLEKNAGRRAAIWINAIVALCLSLRAVSAQLSSNPGTRDTWASERVTTLLGQFLTEALTTDGVVGAGDPIVRAAASEAIGRLAALSGTQYLASQMKNLVDSVVNNRTPSARAGCAWAFGAVHSHVGGLASGPLLKTTVNVLMSLANDPHGVVHLHALKALGRVVDSASLGYAPYVSGTLGMLLRICVVDTHERETVGNRNGSGGLDLGEAGWGGDGGGAVDRAVCKVIDALIGVLGPDIVESTRTRALILGLVNAFWVEGGGAASFGQQSVRESGGGGGLYNVGTGVEAIKCIQHLLIFAPEHADVPMLVKRFRAHLASPSLALRPLKVASINALYQLVQKDAVAMSKLGGDKLVEDLFSLLDDGEEEGGVRRVIESWLTQTGILNPRAWIGLCQRIMGRTTAGQRAADSTQVGSGGDEGESLSGGTSGGVGSGNSARTHQTSRWRTQLFALQCLHSICSLVAASDRKEHLSAIVARAQGLPLENMLFSSVGDLIKMAFTASTAYVTDIRLAGLVVLRDVIETFSTSPDPAYDDALLLEQHQAPITAALTPAFSSDSTPEILASAVNACAVFVGCGVVKDVSRMGRILKLLITALEQSKESGMLSLGDAGELSPNASAMLRISTLSAWAKLQVDSARQKYLEDVLKPYRPTLASLWVSTLRDYASIRVDTEGLDAASSVLDSSYGTLGREVLLPYYAQSWSLILRAVATSMENNDPYVLAAMDGQEPSTASTSKPPAASPRKEPTALFFVLFGLVYEALATSAVDTTSLSAPTLAQRQSVLLASLSALKFLVRPEYAGNAILSEPTIFDEFLSLSYRIAMTEPANVQILLIEVVQQWAVASAPLLRMDPKADDDFLSLTAPPAHCLRLCAHIIKQAIGSRGAGAQAGDVLSVIRTCFSAYSSVLAMVPTSGQREDVRSIGILLFADILKDESTEQDYVSPALPTLKALLEVPLGTGDVAEAKERYSRLVNALLSSCLLNVDGMRGRSGAISRKKIKTNLLAAVLALTVVPPWVKIGREVVEHAAFLITQKMLDLDDTTLTATHCAKTLILASASGNPILGQCTRLVLPGVVEFVAKLVPSVADGSVSEQHATAISEVWKAFGTLFANTPDETRSRLLGVLIPVMLLPLSVASPGQGPIIVSLTTQTTHQLLGFAAASPAAFKEATGKLEAGSRELLEQSIRRVAGAANAGGAGAATVAAKPQITLKAF